MNEIINEKIDVITSFNRSKGIVMPRRMRWQGREYTLTKLTYHHKVRLGRVVFHIFHVTDGNIDFKLKFDPDNLHWTLEEVCDGTPS